MDSKLDVVTDFLRSLPVFFEFARDDAICKNMQ